MNRYQTELVARMHGAAHTLDGVARDWPAWLDATRRHAPGVAASRTDTDGTGSGDVSDPTGAAVAAAQLLERGVPVEAARPVGWRTDPVVADVQQVERLLAEVFDRLHRVAGIVHGYTRPQPPRDRSRPVSCRSIGCDTVIETRLSELAPTPYCAPCYRWLLEHDATTVPAAVLAARRRDRERVERRRGEEGVPC